MHTISIPDSPQSFRMAPVPGGRFIMGAWIASATDKDTAWTEVVEGVKLLLQARWG